MHFDIKESSYYSYGAEDQRVVETIANRYIGANPPLPFIFRAFSKAGVMQNEEGLYLLDFTDKYRDASNGSYAYAMAMVWSDEERSIDGVMEPLGPITLYMNEQKLYRSTVIEELKPDGRVAIPLLFNKGWNTLLIEARKTVAGFGCRFGAEEGKVRILQVLAPFSGRAGQAGWIYSEPCSQSIYGGVAGASVGTAGTAGAAGRVGVAEQGSEYVTRQSFPNPMLDEEATGLQWYPRVSWTKPEQELPNLERIFGYQPQAGAFALSTLKLPVSSSVISLSLQTYGAAKVWLDDRLVFTSNNAGVYNEDIAVDRTRPEQQVKVWSASGSEHWGFQLSFTADQAQLELKAPIAVQGHHDCWLYCGPYSDAELNPAPLSTAPIVDDQAGSFPFHQLLEVKGRKQYWQLDAPSLVVRPYYENSMLSNKWTVGTMSNFARWDYPLGVTMYGLLRTGKQLQREDIVQYALHHIKSCTDWYEYSLWDYEEYGFPSINHQLVLIKMLDNCGSFGSAMLEAYSVSKDDNFLKIAEVIADFILNKLEKQADGAFYRTCEGEYSANTMWADDLYMSTPFLIRYSSITGRTEALDEAAKQFVLYKKYLFIDDAKLMSHVYDFKYNRATRVPWGRGNGWVLFSLSELLERLSESHALYDELLSFYREFVAGIASYQSDSGLWRQVVNEPESYQEASCTAMFVYGIARGIRYGWLQEDQLGYYEAVAQRGWAGLTKQAIDRQGHVHGVCSGSRYSFAPDYYMYDLRTVLNDNHGIGIMMLAGVEMELLRLHGKAL